MEHSKYIFTFPMRLSVNEKIKMLELCERYGKTQSDLMRYCLNYFYSTVNKKSGNKIIKDEFGEQINILNRELENINKKLNAINERIDGIKQKNESQNKNIWKTIKRLIQYWGVELFFCEKILRRVYRDHVTDNFNEEVTKKMIQTANLIMVDAPPKKQSAAKNNPVKGNAGDV
jgi:predicted transcriptional regulator